MTERLYYNDAYLTSFSARVVARANDGRRVYLDRSAFYPTSGGQQFDLGTLGGIAIQDVVDEDDRVAHVLAAPLTAENADGVVDWKRRYDHMQQHTGQHLLSAIGDDLFGYPTVSVHFGNESASIDFGTEIFARSRIADLEHRANEIVFENRPVQVTFEESSSATALRKPSDRDGMLRIVTINGIDRSACGGTHVRHTGEIGSIVLRRVEKVRSATRVEFLCGMRTVDRARADFEALTTIGQSLSASLDQAPTLVEAQSAQLRDAESRAKRAETELAGYRAKELWAATAPGEDGIRRVIQQRPSGSVEDVRAFALAFALQPKAFFLATSEQPPSILLATSADSGIEAGRVLKEALTAAGGRGGGSPRLAQGSVPGKNELDAVIAAVTTRA